MNKAKAIFKAVWSQGLRGIFAVVVGSLLLKHVPGIDPLAARAAGQAAAAGVEAAVQ